MQLINVAWRPVGNDRFEPGITCWTDEKDVPGFTPLVPGKHVAWRVTGPRRCVGMRDARGSYVRCPESTVLSKDRTKCGPCSAMDEMDPCVRCDGRTCKASEERRIRCASPKYAVYLAVFKDQTLKVGVSTLDRLRLRWLEQGADFGGIITVVDGGFKARRLEDSFGRLPGATKQMRSGRKISWLLKPMPSDQAQELVNGFLSSNKLTEAGSSVALEDLSRHYCLSGLDSRPQRLQPSSMSTDSFGLLGDVVGLKGALLITKLGSIYNVTNLKQLIGYEVCEDAHMSLVAQSGLLDFE